MHFPTALHQQQQQQQQQPQQQQQRLTRDYPQSPTPNMSYPPSAQSPHPHPQHSYSTTSYGAFGSSMAHYNATAYAAQQQQQQHQHQHYDTTYSGRLNVGNTPGNGQGINAVGGLVSSFYSNRARYLPYQQPLAAHSMRGMYTPAGQQLIPSSVLHYPPRGAPYQQNSLALQQQRPLAHTPYTLQQHTQPQPQPQLRQQQQPLSQSPPHHTAPFAADGSQMRHYADTPNTAQAQQPTYTQTTRPTPHLIMHLTGGGSPPATPTPTPTPPPPPTPTPNPPTLNVTRPPSVDCNAYMQLQRHQHLQLQQHYRQQQQLQQHQQQSSISTLQALTNVALSSLRSQSEQQCTALSQRSPVLKMLPTSSISSKLPTIVEETPARTRDCHEEEPQPSHSLSNSTGAGGASGATNLGSSTSAVSSPRLTVSSSDCLTTSPPLISATGTDSGISVSSCSTRARSDSTQSTPVYNGEYPMSVGSSSGVSYHCADIKDFEEFGREKEEQMACNVLNENENENENLKLKQEFVEGEINEERLKGNNIVDGEIPRERASNAKKKCEGKEYLQAGNAAEITTKEHGDKTNKDKAEDDLSGCKSRIKSPSSTPSDTAKYYPVNSPTAELSKAQLPENNSTKKAVDSFHLDEHVNECKETTELQQLQQQHKQNEPEEINQHSGHARTNFTNTDNACWTSSPHSPQHSPYFERTQLQQSNLPSPPVPPAPPQNSPVDYCPATNTPNMSAFGYSALPVTPLKPPITAAAAAAAAAVAAAAAAAAATIRTNKNRIMENDLIPNKKSKRKTHLNAGKRQKGSEGSEAGEGGKDKRDMTPLPGFQQAFGSTEIGRFFETFLLSPPDCHSFSDSYESFDVEEQLQQIHQQQQQQQQHQQHQLQIQQEQQQQLQLNQMHQQQQQQQTQQQHHQQQQQQQQQQYAPHDYFNSSSYHTQRLHPHYPHPHLHPQHPYYRGQAHHPYPLSSGNSYRDMWLYGRRAPSPYDLPYEYGGGTRVGSGSPASPYEMPLSARTTYGSAYDRMSYTYGRMNGNFSGIRCNGY